MNEAPLASIIVNNYNYGRYLGGAIDSALGQTYPRTEVVVVDDGSADDSRAVLAGYGGRVTAVLKANGGQASALNAGLRASRGEVVLFLDSDDALLPTAAARAVGLLRGPGVVKAHWPLWEIDALGRRTGQTVPGDELPEGDWREAVRRDGPSVCASPPTSGNAWARRFLEEVFPVPEEEYRLCADEYLYVLAPALGSVKRAPEPLGLYRRHGQNYYQGKSFEEKLNLGLATQERLCRALNTFFRGRGVEVDPERWKRHSWYHRLRLAVQDLAARVPAGDTLILVDEDRWATGPAVAGRHVLPFRERGGQYWGRPADDAQAIDELERLRRAGTHFLAFAWPAFWWLDYYAAFCRHLRARYRRVLENDRLILYDLRPEPATAGGERHE